jgi:hypothetical protein
MTSTKAELTACVIREIALRERVYPRWIERGKMTQAKAQFEIRTMRDVLEALGKYVPNDPPPPQTDLFGERGRRA